MNPIPAYYGLLHKGTNGPDVALVQTWLNSIRDTCSWFEPLKVDGHFGPHMEKAVMEFQLRHRLNADGRFGAKTAEAVRRFQSRAKLPADGIVGKATWDALYPET